MKHPLATVEDTIAWGCKLSRELRSGDVLAFAGNLGAGKTHATKGVIAGLDCAVDVSSPTFTLVHEYTGGRLPAFHFDFYRLEFAAEVIGIGWDDYLDAAGIVIVEWADRFPDLLPANTRWFYFEIEPDGTRSVEER